MQKQSNTDIKEQKLKSDAALSSDNANDEAAEAFKQAIEKRDDNPEEC